MVKNVKRYMKQQKKDLLADTLPDFVPVTYILPQVVVFQFHGFPQLCLQSMLWRQRLSVIMTDIRGNSLNYRTIACLWKSSGKPLCRGS